MGPQHIEATRKRKKGAPPGNRNAFKTGRYVKRNLKTTAEVARLKRQVRAVLRLAEAALKRRDSG